MISKTFNGKTNIISQPVLKDDFSPPKPKNAYQAIVDKDLFRPERTEWKSTTQEGANAALRVPPQILVYGIVITHALKYAWIQEQGKTEKMKKISEGGEINGWKVSNIDSNSLSVKNGEQILKFYLIQPGKPKTGIIPRPTMQSPPKVSPGPQPSGATSFPNPPLLPPPPPLPQKK